jgi:hypothetical protein
MRIGMVILAMISVIFSSCARQLGWGVLLWSTDDPAVPSGTVVPVYIMSNINQVWIAGIPEAYRVNEIDKMEIPLPKLELIGARTAAQRRADEFSGMALTYAETLQDGLPIRETPDNNAKRVYRLRMGEIIKVLSKIEGTPAINTAGVPLPGSWFSVMTENGTTGYCFSYRLRLFEHNGGALVATTRAPAEYEDTDLETLLTKQWVPESYETMVNQQQIDIDELSRHWGFSPGLDTGIARINVPNVDRSFAYTAIRTDGSRAWRFEGTSLQMSLRSDNLLAVQYTDAGSAPRTVLFTALFADIDDLVMQESARRDAVYESIWALGPVFSSANYGTLSFLPDGRFTWTGYNLLVPQFVSVASLGSGTVKMNLFVSRSLRNSFDGALSFHFDGIGATGSVMNIVYTIDAQGLRIEYVPPANIDSASVYRRASSPLVIYFFKAANPVPEVPFDEVFDESLGDALYS